MKICLTVNSSPWSSFKGGGQLAVHYLAQQLVSMGHQVWVVYSFDTITTGVKLDAVYEILWVNHSDIKTLNLNTITIARAVYQLGRKVGLDIIHGNGDEAFFLPWIARTLKTKFMCTTHAPTIVARGFFSSLSRPLQLLKELNLHLFRSALTHSDGIITYSRYSSEMVQRSLGNYPKEKIFQVTPGVHPSWLELVRKKNEEYALIFFGRIEYEKGIDVLIRAFKKVVATYPQCMLHMVGEGNYERTTRALAQSLHLSGNIHFHGWKKLADLQKMVGESTICVLPSRVESFGLSISEAMASGVPVISTNVAAIPELITHNETGLLVQPDDPDGLGNAILYALGNGEKMNAMAVNARHKIQSHFTWDKTARACVAIYEQYVQ